MRAASRKDIGSNHSCQIYQESADINHERSPRSYLVNGQILEQEGSLDRVKKALYKQLRGKVCFRELSLLCKDVGISLEAFWIKQLALSRDQQRSWKTE